MATRETELPGVGNKHTIELASGEELVIVEHRAAHWELARIDADGNTHALIKLQPKEANEAGRVLSHGNVPKKDTRKQLLLDEFSIEWVKLAKDSPLAGSTLQAAEVRARTGVNVIARLREDGSILSPPPDTGFAAGDTVVVIGSRDQVDRFLATFAPTPPADEA